MKTSIKKGLGFGLTSGIITTLGLIVGLNSSTRNISVVVGGILIIAVADSLSDALGVHISEESENRVSARDLWITALSTLMTKLVLTLSFLAPVLLLGSNLAIIASVIWGVLLLTFFSFYIARQNKSKPIKVIFEHVGVATLVMIVTYFVGELINNRIN